jgi:mannitol operon transcriptional antiterminator
MFSLTTRQRDILQILLKSSEPVSSQELAGLLNLTPRQVNYSIRGVKVWLNQQDQDLRTYPGAGFALTIHPEQARNLTQKINTHRGVQIILSVSQRQQLLALFLLTQDEPHILSQIEQIAQVSRMTITKDLDEIEFWFNSRGIILVRKPHFGIQISGEEQTVQQALAEILWGETPFSGDPIVQISHAEGLVFTLAGDASLLPIVDSTSQFLNLLNIRRAVSLVAKAEEQLGGRFTDDAVLHMALSFAITAVRIRKVHHLPDIEFQLTWLEKLPVWPVASFIAQKLGQDTHSFWKPGDVAGIAIQMMAAPRSEILPGEVERYEDFARLTEQLLDYISSAIGISKLKYDRTLQNGLLTYIVPASYRQRFQIWFPMSLSQSFLPEQDDRETVISSEIFHMVYEHTGIHLPAREMDYLVVLLRAAIIRNRTHLYDRIIVICPSGIATAQLLVARLHARFPYLSNLEVTSLRDLTPALVESANLILSTVPLPRQYMSSKVIEIHPLLMPEDIDAITVFLS